MPSELFLKFREEVQGFRVGLNLEFYNSPINECQGKLVLKPLSDDRRWKFIYEPLHHDVRLVSKKIPITKFLNLQVGIGHNIQSHAIGWKWKLTSSLGGDGISRIRNKTCVGLCPGVDLRFGWRADYVLPEFTGAVGTGDDALFNMNSGRLEASLDRIETILTHTATSNPSPKLDDNVSSSLKLDNENELNSSQDITITTAAQIQTHLQLQQIPDICYLNGGLSLARNKSKHLFLQHTVTSRKLVYVARVLLETCYVLPLHQDFCLAGA
ncbi:hypothetical protein HanRHA438_Chr03g0097891 [Helianthus annuus]|uniref:DUF7781 domain-containing protein n=2 Tax=Helianthus annuus TaxID=4232 RepID=A0A251V370_HELAN|nr:hypothetical protein HanXRQr2_Chr03g0086751 [Helianthus annuus]KAJ0606307.1 hypothetical protein HanHA89_Chr03g0083641 [Helianthus annuus]KAJ0766401.1 hypothetical protein HanLR1_Chr03g0077171 [Helianthus annuus]KAJ0933589.1 hypothetical protein HanRHA438_Chr03g0097891 [Helianthus annuus]